MIYRELSAEEFNDLASRILYEDNHLLVVNKKVVIFIKYSGCEV
jgi:23S rRNA pseudouridine1911/1915/1917 synthase